MFGLSLSAESPPHLSSYHLGKPSAGPSILLKSLQLPPSTRGATSNSSAQHAGPWTNWLQVPLLFRQTLPRFTDLPRDPAGPEQSPHFPSRDVSRSRLAGTPPATPGAGRPQGLTYVLTDAMRGCYHHREPTHKATEARRRVSAIGEGARGKPGGVCGARFLLGE